MDPYEISIFLAQKPHERYQPAQRRYWGNIYIEKFANIGRSELRWDISGLFLDDRDISGFSLIDPIIVHMTGHFL